MTKSLRKYSVLSGLSLLIMAITAGIGYGYVHPQIIDNLILTIQKTNLLNIEIAAWFVVIVLDLLVTYGFYQVLKQTHAHLAIISSIARLIYTFFLVAAVYQLLSLSLNSNSISLKNALSYIKNFETIWSIGLIIFGLHLLLVGVTTLKGTFPKLLGYLLILAGIGYITVHLLQQIYPDLATTQMIENIMILPMTVGELGFGLWLLIRGGKSIDKS